MPLRCRGGGGGGTGRRWNCQLMPYEKKYNLGKRETSSGATELNVKASCYEFFKVTSSRRTGLTRGSD